VVLSVEVSASLGENTLAAGPHTIANINIKPRTSSKAQAYALQLAALQLLKIGMHLWLTTWECGLGFERAVTDGRHADWGAREENGTRRGPRANVSV